MKPEERIEAVARAIASKDAHLSFNEARWASRAEYARAAIIATLQSLLEPTPAIWAAWVDSPPPFGEVTPMHILETAIRAAIKEHAEPSQAART